MAEVFAGSESYARRADQARPVLSIGNFDGVHVGHKHLLRALIQQARELGAPTCIYTFEPPPRVVLAPHLHRPRISCWPEKVRLLSEAGIDQVVVERFTRAFAQHPPEWFVDVVLAERLNPAALTVGYDFRFGRARGGDLALLRRHLPLIPVSQVSAHAVGDRIVSSSAVRELVQQGQVARAAEILDRPHEVAGTVVAGHQRGRRMGFPTANIETDAELIPAPGVYAVWLRPDDGGWLPAVANLGAKPTFGDGAPTLEVHALDFSGDLYGQGAVVAFVKRLRDVRRFDGPNALMAQIRADVEAALAVFATSAAPAPR